MWMLYNLKQLNILLTWNSLSVFLYLALGPSVRLIQPACDPYAVCTRVRSSVNCSGQSLHSLLGYHPGLSSPPACSVVSLRMKGHQAICLEVVQGTRLDSDMHGLCASSPAM